MLLMVNYGGNTENGKEGITARITEHTRHPAILDFHMVGASFLSSKGSRAEQNRN